MNNLGTSLQARFRQFRVTEDLDRAIELYLSALSLRPIGHPERTKPFGNLANAYYVRFEHIGNTEDLENSITYNRAVLRLRPAGHPELPPSLNNLAIAVSARFFQTGHLEDLEEAISYNIAALSLRPSGHPERFMSLNNLGHLLCSRFQAQGVEADLEKAIVYHSEALSLCTSGHVGRVNSLAGLAIALRYRLEVMPGSIEDLNTAVQLHIEALSLSPLGHGGRPMALANLAAAIFDRFKKFNGQDDLVAAIQYAYEAKGALPAMGPMHTRVESDLAHLELQRHLVDPENHPISVPFELYRASVSHGGATVRSRFEAALRWAYAAHKHCHDSVVDAYSSTLSLLQRYMHVEPTLEARQKFFASRNIIPRSFASEAASGAIMVGDIESAVELLEQGRSMIWATMRNYRHPLDHLHEVDLMLAEQFQKASGNLERLAMYSGGNHPPFLSTEKTQQDYGKAVAEWDTLVHKIRALDGFSHFLKAAPFNILQSAAAEGPVIIVNISRYRSDAIIVRAEEAPTLVPLPGVSPTSLAPVASTFADPRASSATNFSKNLAPVLKLLWDQIVCPVTKHLAQLGVAPKTRIWWCPTSELCALPLHAAGPYKPKEKNLPDLFVCSYTPTLSALITARLKMTCTPGAPKLLVVGQPANLPQVEEEMRRIQLFGDFVHTLVGREAQKELVITHLHMNSWVHFACHGHRHPEPFRSSFALHRDDRLEVRDLIKANLPKAELAFVSACHGAAVDVEGTPDEVIHLSAALQFCGFRSVVGTLWAMADIDGPDIAEDFYRYMFRDLGNVDVRDAATALNLATREMRKRRGMTLGRWVNFIHIGI